MLAMRKFYFKDRSMHIRRITGYVIEKGLSKYFFGNIKFILLLSVLCLYWGCLGSRPVSLDSDLRSMWIPMMENRTMEYGAEEPVTSAIIEEMMRAPEIRVVNRKDATSILRGKITGYKITSLDLDSRDRVTGYDMFVTVEVWLEDTSGNIVIKPKEFSQSGVYHFASSPPEIAESVVLRRLSMAVRSYIIEGW